MKSSAPQNHSSNPPQITEEKAESLRDQLPADTIKSKDYLAPFIALMKKSASDDNSESLADIFTQLNYSVYQLTDIIVTQALPQKTFPDIITPLQQGTVNVETLLESLCLSNANDDLKHFISQMVHLIHAIHHRDADLLKTIHIPAYGKNPVDYAPIKDLLPEAGGAEAVFNIFQPIAEVMVVFSKEWLSCVLKGQDTFPKIAELLEADQPPLPQAQEETTQETSPVPEKTFARADLRKSTGSVTPLKALCDTSSENTPTYHGKGAAKALRFI